MVHLTPTKRLLATTYHPLAGQLSGSLAQGVRLIDQFLHDEPTPTKMAEFEQNLRDLLREVGRRILAWVLNRLEPEGDEDVPIRVQFEGGVISPFPKFSASKNGLLQITNQVLLPFQLRSSTRLNLRFSSHLLVNHQIGGKMSKASKTCNHCFIKPN